MKRIIYLLLIVSCWTACSQNEQNTETATTSSTETDIAIDKIALAQEIKVLENSLVKTQDATKDTTTASELVKKVELYANTFPQDSLTPFILFRAGDVARGARNPAKAVQIWDRTWRTYEGHRIVPGALFAMAFTYDTDLDNFKEADRYYRKFLFKFPDHQLAAIQKDPEELIREFKKKEKEQ